LAAAADYDYRIFGASLYDSIEQQQRGYNQFASRSYYNLVWTNAIHSPADFALGLIGFGLLMFWHWPPWIVVLLSAAAGEILSRF
jgi:hypothetical protein